MAIIKFSKVGPADRPPGEAGMLGARIDLMKAQRGAASMQAALNAVQLGDAVMQSKPINAAVDEIKMRAGQVYDWATDKPPSPAEERIRLRREAANAVTGAGGVAGDAGGAGAVGRPQAAPWGGLSGGLSQFGAGVAGFAEGLPRVPGPGDAPYEPRWSTPTPEVGGAREMAKAPTLPDNWKTVKKGETGYEEMLEFRAYRADREGWMEGRQAELDAASAKGERRAGALRSLVGVDPPGTRKLRAGTRALEDFGGWIAGALPRGKTAAMVAEHVTPVDTADAIGRAISGAAFGENPLEILESERGGAAASLMADMASGGPAPAGEAFRTSVSGPSDSPTRALGLGIAQAERAATDLSPSVDRKFRAQTKRAELFDIVKRLDDAKRQPQAWPPINPRTGKPYDIDNMELRGLVSVAAGRPLGPEQEAELIVLAREKAVSDGLLNMFGGKYKNEAADMITAAQKEWRKNNPPVDLVQVAGRIARMDRTGAQERKLDAEEAETVVDTYWSNAMGGAKTYNLWMKHAMSPTGRKFLLRRHIKKNGGGARGKSLVDGWNLKRPISDTTPNSGGKSNHQLYDELLNMSVNGDKGAKAAIAALKVNYDLANSAQRISDASSAVNERMQLAKNKENRLRGVKKSDAWKRWKLREKMLWKEWELAGRSREELVVKDRWVNSPGHIEVANRFTSLKAKIFEHADKEPSTSKPDVGRRPGPQDNKGDDGQTMNERHGGGGNDDDLLDTD